MAQAGNIYVSIQYEHCLPTKSEGKKKLNVNFTIN